MTARHSFSREIRRFVLIGLSVLVLIYSLGLAAYLQIGSIGAAAFELEILGKRYVRARLLDPQAPLPAGANLQSYLTYAELPAHIRARLDRKDAIEGNLFGISLLDLDDRIDRHGNDFYFVFAYPLGPDRYLFMAQGFADHEEAGTAFDAYDDLAILILVLGGAFLGLAVIATGILARRLSDPARALAAWAEGLMPDSLERQPPDFRYGELNSIAARLHESLHRIDALMRHERAFLRRASHELRTPVTIIRGNTDLLRRQNGAGETPPDGALSRIDRAARRMQHLIDTILWLERPRDREREEGEPVDVETVVREALDELQGTAPAPDIAIHIDVAAPESLARVPATALHIVASNLLRNALQHTPKGEVAIAISADRLRIENRLDQTGRAPGKGEGTGIGLDLVRQVCRRSGWHMHVVENESGGLAVSIGFAGGQETAAG